MRLRYQLDPRDVTKLGHLGLGAHVHQRVLHLQVEDAFEM
jgi:hypothetical protein